ncbi:MAG TPA: AraC family transcriptional regulator [Polyangiaceae bacterium]|nr:AraC family transcriptional regulator [Polyangiaceae bacterium]
MASRPSELTPALVAPIITRYFEALNASATLVLSGQRRVYRPVFRRQQARDPLQFEHKSDAFARRMRYNERSCARAERSGELVLGRQGLFVDLFAPIVADAGALGCVVTGPFVEERPSARQLAAEFERLSRRRARPRDPEFVAFSRATLATTVLGGESRAALERFLRTYAGLLAGRLSAGPAFEEFEELWAAAALHQPERRMGRLARGLVDDFESAMWRSTFGDDERAALGVTALPNQVLALQPIHETQGDTPGEELVHAEAFQVGLARWSRQQPGALIGRVGDEGAFVLVHVAVRRRTQRRAELSRLARELTRYCQRSLGVQLRVGVGMAASAGELPSCYQQATAALNLGFRARERVVFFEDHQAELQRGESSIDAHTADLERAFEEGSSRALAAGLESFLQATAWRAAFNLEVVHALFECVLGRLLRTVQARGLLEQEALAASWQRYRSEAGRRQSWQELSLLFEHTVLDLATAFVDQRYGDRAARLERAAAYVARNFKEPLTLAAMARRSGFSASYFSSLFKAHHGMGFERYLAEARLRRARELLRAGELPVHRVAVECGFQSYFHFSRTWRRLVGSTPRAYRSAR